MRWFWTCTLCLTLTATASAQPRIGGGLRGGGVGGQAGAGIGSGLAGGALNSPGTLIHFVLLEQPSVQQELRLTPEQQQQAKQSYETQRQKLQGLSGQPRDQLPQKVSELQSAADKELQSILSPEQFARLREIGLQKIGLLALSRADVAESMQLTPEQKQQIRALNEQLIQTAMQSAQALQPAGGGRPKLRELKSKLSAVQNTVAQLQAAKKNTETKILALLTAEQKARWTQIQGAPFQGQINLGPLGNQLLGP